MATPLDRRPWRRTSLISPTCPPFSPTTPRRPTNSPPSRWMPRKAPDSPPRLSEGQGRAASVARRIPDPFYPNPALAPGFRVLRRTSMSFQHIQASFHRTAEGRLAARVADIAFLALPAEDQGFRVAYASGLSSPPERWTRRDFYGLGRLVDGEAGFRGFVEERAEHHRQLAVLNRRDVKTRAPTPWGTAQQSRLYGEGVIAHSTAEHGGLLSIPSATPSWMHAGAMPTVGTRRTRNGRRSRRHSQPCSLRPSARQLTNLCATPSLTPTRRFMAWFSNPAKAGSRTSGPSRANTRPTGS